MDHLVNGWDGRVDTPPASAKRRSGWVYVNTDEGSRTADELSAPTAFSSVSIKQLAIRLLRPPAVLKTTLGRRLMRVWSHALLACQISYPLPSSAVISGTPEVHGTGRIKFGERILLFRELYLETRGSGTINIGDESVISRGVHIVSFARVDIGIGTMIGEYSSIRDANHRSGGPDLIRYSGHDAAPISVGRNVWIGRGVTILPGVTIGDNAIIGANAVVTHDIPGSTIAVGIPARVLKRTSA